MQAFNAFLARRGGPFSIDGVIAVALLVVAQLELALSHHIQGPGWVNAVAAAGVTLPVAFRRPFPLYVAPLMIGFLIWQEALDGDVVENSIAAIITLPLAMYSMGVLLGRRRALIGFGVSLALVWILVMISMSRSLDDFVTALVVTGGPFLVGRIVNARMALAHELREKATRLEREQDESAKLAVAEERARIAREMHDVIAHNLSVMVVQSSAARRMIDLNPERASEALASVEHTGREALAEMRRMLDMLKADDEEAPELAPQPSMGDLETLLERARAAGLDVELAVEGERKRMQSSVDLSCFRIVQEALRNTLEHADAAHARVHLRYSDDEVEVDVSDDGHGPRSEGSSGAGHGLVGMRERVSMLGGRIEAGQHPDGGFQVRATLPLEPDDR